MTHNGQVAYAQFNPTTENAGNWQAVTGWSPDPSLPENFSVQARDAQAAALSAAIAANCASGQTAQKACSVAEALLSDPDDPNNKATANGYFQGGNFNFNVTLDGDLSCGSDRCNGIHTDYGYTHLDTANPYWDVESLAAHAFVDVFLGNLVYTVIPRPWP